MTTAPVGFLELDLDVTEQARSWQRKAREFAEDVVGPVGFVLDRMDASEAVAPGSPIFDFVAQAHREGFTRLGAPRGLGGAGLSRMEEHLVLEELAAADAGLAGVLLAAPMPYRWALALGGAPLARELAVPYLSGERSDWIGCTVLPRRAACVRAVRDGGGWSLTGTGSPWAANSATATHAAIVCALESHGLDRLGLALVPLGSPGVRRGPPLDTIGLRTLGRAELRFESVHVPAHAMVTDASAVSALAASGQALVDASTALLAFGTARAAYEGAQRDARERVRRGDLPDGEQPTRVQLFRMFTLLEAARAVTRAVFLYTRGKTDTGEPCSAQHARAARSFSTDAASRIADMAMQLCGGRATRRDGVAFLDGSAFFPERLLRDAQACKLADGETPMAGPLGAADL